jgi:hypothetical protein
MSRNRLYVRSSVIVITVCAVIFVTAVLIAGQQPAIDVTTDTGLVITKIEDQVSLLKWVGGAIITALTGTIAVLYRSLEKANIDSREQFKVSMEKREEILNRTLESNHALNEAMKSLLDANRVQCVEIKENFDCLHTEVAGIKDRLPKGKKAETV